MSVKYIDGFGCYSLNGVRTKAEYVLTPADKLKPGNVLKEKNVGMRRELIRKIGIHRMISYGKSIEKSDRYELVDMCELFEGINYAPFLLMKNPSIDAVHLEGVHPDCRSIQQAINWRAGNINKEWQPIKLT